MRTIEVFPLQAVPLERQVALAARLISEQEQQMSVEDLAAWTLEWDTADALVPQAFPAPLELQVTAPPYVPLDKLAAISALVSVGDPNDVTVQVQSFKTYRPDDFDLDVFACFVEVYNCHEHELCLDALAKVRENEAAERKRRREEFERTVRITDKRRVRLEDIA